MAQKKSKKTASRSINRDAIALIFVIVVVIVGYFAIKNRDLVFQGAFAPPASNLKVGTTAEKASKKSDVEVFVEGLEIPWEIVFLPDGDMLVTERPGRLVRITPEGEKTTIEVPNVNHVGEGGLLGLALHPEFESNQRIYLYHTYAEGNPTNQIIAYKLVDDALEAPVTILENIPGAKNHNGGRIKFGPDLYLYVTTGDAQEPDAAQDLSSLAGKILRITVEGKVPEDNPFEGNPVYSYGHRNAQGITWTENGLLWSTEHGRSGAQTGLDELNLIFPSGNYGWPEIDGDRTRADMTNPEIHSGPDETWAPGSAEYYDGSIYWGGLRGQAVFEAELADNLQDIQELVVHFREDFGRIRTVRMGPDGMMYLLTSNEDGRGESSESGDKIIRVNPEVFK